MVEQKLRENELQYSSLIELQRTGILVHRDFKIVFANAAAMQMFGAESVEDLLGRTSLELTHPDNGDTQMAVRAMKEGAFDFVEKPINNQMLLQVAHKAIDKSRNLIADLDFQDEIQVRMDLLTPREKDVLEMIAKGKLNKQIAFDLGITQRTVEVHRARVMEKMQARTVADLLRTVMSLDTFVGKP